MAALSVLFLPVHGDAIAWCVGGYLVRMFGVTAGYHRYFSHRSYKLGRVAQFLMAVLAQTSGSSLTATAPATIATPTTVATVPYVIAS